MEHIVQFGVNIDDEAIKKAIVNNVMNQVAAEIKHDAIKTITGNGNYTKLDYSYKLKEIVMEVTNDFLEANKEKIIEETTSKLVDRLAKAKAVKEMVSSAINSLME